MKPAAFAFFAFLPAAALAQAPAEGTPADWFALTAQLRSEGLEPSRIDWLSVNSMCLGLKTDRDAQQAYNACRLTKARDSVQWFSDRNACDGQSLAAYPDQLRFERPTQTTTVTGTAQGLIVQQSAPGITRRELGNLRRAAYVACMRGLGWNNADNWKQGRRNP